MTLTETAASAAETRMMRDTARAFADRAIRPIAAELDRNERFPAELYGELAALGMFGITIASFSAAPART